MCFISVSANIYVRHNIFMQDIWRDTVIPVNYNFFRNKCLFVFHEFLFILETVKKMFDSNELKENKKRSENFSEQSDECWAKSWNNFTSTFLSHLAFFYMDGLTQSQNRANYCLEPKQSKFLDLIVIGNDTITAKYVSVIDA